MEERRSDVVLDDEFDDDELDDDELDDDDCCGCGGGAICDAVGVLPPAAEERTFESADAPPVIMGRLLEMMRCVNRLLGLMRKDWKADVSSERSVRDGDALARDPLKSNLNNAGGGVLRKLTNVLGLILTSLNFREMRGL